MRSKAWLAASVWLQLARLLPPASRVRRSRRLRGKLEAAPGLLAHDSVTEVVKICPMGSKLRYTALPVISELSRSMQTPEQRQLVRDEPTALVLSRSVC
jgi:hypothetical protein